MDSSHARLSSQSPVPSARVIGSAPPPSQSATLAYGRRQATLAAFSRRVLAVSNVTELLEAATRAIAHALQTEYVAAFEYDRAANQLYLRAGGGWREGAVGNTTLHGGTEFHEGYTLDRPDPILVADHNSEIRFAASPLLVEHGVLSSVCSALRLSQEACGLLGAYALRPRAFTQDDAQFLQVVAHVAGAALARLDAESALVTPLKTPEQRHEAVEPVDGATRSNGEAAMLVTEIAESVLRDNNHRLEASRRIGELAAASDTLEVTLQLLVEEIARATGYPMAAVELWDAERELLTLGAATVAPGRGRGEPVERPLPQTLAGPVVRSGKPRTERFDETTPERREALQRIGAATFVCFPLTVRAQVIGALSLAHPEPTTCDQEFAAWLTSVCHTISLLVKSKRSESALREQRDFAMQVMELLGQGVTVSDEHGKFEYVNPTFASLLKRPSKQLIGTVVRDVVVPERRAEFDLHGEKRREKQATTYETQLRAADGAVVDVLVSGAPRLRGGRVVGSISAVTDITARTQADNTLRLSEERFRMVFESGSLGLAIGDSDGRLLEVNQALCEMLGYSAEELVQKSWMEVTHPEDVERSLKLMRKAFRDRASVTSIEKRYLTKTNETVYGRAFISVAHDANGNSLYQIATIEDITEQRRAQERLATLEAERRRQERDGRLQIVRAQDEERTYLARDLHDGLGQMLMALQLSLKSKAQNRDDLASDIRYVGMAISSVRQMSRSLHPAELEVGSVSSVVRQSLSTMSATPRVVVECVGEEPQLGIENKSHLYRIVQEAVTNAIKHGRPSVVTVRFEWKPESLELSVSDDGRGMDSGTESGTGLRNLRDRAQLLHGTTAWKHRQDGGTEFRLSIPKLASPAPADTDA